jgi:acetyltransferase EpsM
MDRALILIGGGGHARVVAEAVASKTGIYRLIGYVDPDAGDERMRQYDLAWLGDDEAVRKHPGAWGVLGVGALGPGRQRREIVSRLDPGLAGWASVVHRSAYVSPTATVGHGSVILAGAILQSGVRIGAHCVVNDGAVVEHDVVLGDYAMVGPGAVVGGGAIVGSGAFVGLRAVIRDHRSVGDEALVGMGAVVVTDVDAGAVVIGNPARRQRRWE